MIPMTDTSTNTTSFTLTASSVPTSASSSAESRLRIVLRANAVNSVAFGILLATIPDTVDRLLDTGHPGWLRVVGLGLVAFAAGCAWLSATSLATLRRLTPHVIAGDIAWVVASVVTVLLGWYSGGGVVAVLTLAAVVDAFAVLQWSAWRKLRIR